MSYGGIMMLHIKHRTLAMAGILAMAQNAGAADIIWGGYLNATGAVSDSDAEYLDAGIDDQGGFGDTSFGLNLGVVVGADLQLAAQLANHPGHEDIDLDWAFASYRVADPLSVAVGQLKYPGNLVSEYVDMGYLYPWIRPPQEIYSHTEVSAAMTLESFRGARILYSGSSGNIEYDAQLYVGAAEEETMTHDGMVGAVFTLSSGATRFLLGYNRANMEMVNMPMAPMNGKDMSVLSAGATTEWRDIVAYAEFVHSETEDIPLLDTNGGYATLGYRFGNTLPHATYSFLKQDSGTGQTAWTLGVRRELTASSALKFEWQRIRPDGPTAAGLAAVPMLAGRAGLFDSIPAEHEIDMLSISVNVFF